MNQVELIIKKRNGLALSRDEIRYLVEGYIKGDIPDYQMSSFLMAIFFQGMSDEEVQTLTETYVNSGKRLKFPEKMRTVDKHSTGGVGDKISLPLAPIVAACGAKIPMISGRGLGHTGGTLDKLESIPGLRTNLDEPEFRKIIDEIGFSIISQSDELVPADRAIYALRDVSGTVESMPLITASVISKKIAEGADNLVIDLKVGSGAFIKEYDQAKELGRLLRLASEGLGQRIDIVYSRMNAPLGNYIGNGLEIKETIEYLRGDLLVRDVDILTRTLARKMLVLSGYAKGELEAQEMVNKAISSGKALELFAKFIELQGGDRRVCDDTTLLPQSKATAPIIADKTGWIKAIDSQQLGYALVDIGAGRKTLGSPLDYSTGAYLPYKIGDKVKTGDVIGLVFCQDRESGDNTAKKIVNSISIVDQEIPEEDILIRF
ncbi:MAG: thymidine phosphorylase [Candidatus Cloacimonadia bacterium]